jgi:SHAQKYF class myb-like DNA-binding protein
MSEGNDSQLPAPRMEDIAELPIRDVVQSHQASNVRTNDYENPSVFASVSPQVPLLQQGMPMVDKGDNSKAIEETIETSPVLHSSVDSSPFSKNGDAWNASALPKTHNFVSQENTLQDMASTKQKKRRRLNNMTSSKLNGLQYRSSSSSGRWTAAEHQAFCRGLAIYGREWKRVAQDIPTRTSAQVRSHAQKYFTKLEKPMSLSSNCSLPFISQDDPSRAKVAATHRNHSLGSVGYSSCSTDEGDPSNSGTSNDGYATMSDSVRREAARILANPATVEHEVRNTLERLRVRYQQLKERLEVQQQHGGFMFCSGESSPNRNRQEDRPDDITGSVVVQEDDELIALHVLQGLQQHVESKRNNQESPNGVNPPN